MNKALQETTPDTPSKKNSRGSLASAKLLALLGAFVLSASMMLALTGCGDGTTGNESDSSGSGTANVANPIVEVESPEDINKELGFNLVVPEEASVSSCSIIGETLGEVIFTLDGATYTYRAMNTVRSEDISGLYYDFSSHAEVEIAGVTCEIEYNDDGPGSSRWFDSAAETTYSVSVDAGASEQSLTDISTRLIAEQRLIK